MAAEKYMQAAICNAAEREAAFTEKRIFPGHCSGSAETPFGRLAINYIVAQGRNTWRPEHMRKCWTLNGKRISQDKLIAVLKD